VSYVTETRVR